MKCAKYVRNTKKLLFHLSSEIKGFILLGQALYKLTLQLFVALTSLQTTLQTLQLELQLLLSAAVNSLFYFISFQLLHQHKAVS